MKDYRDQIVATEDPPSNGVNNPIHDALGADAAGYKAALVTGVRTYGWAVQTLTQALGTQWLDSGWVDFQLRRPLYAGETLSIRLHQAADHWMLACSAKDAEQERVVLEGSAGNGVAPWLQDLDPPPVAAPLEALADLPSYDLSSVPLRVPLRPLGAYVSRESAKNMVSEDLGLSVEHYLGDGTAGYIHPYFLAGRVAPLTRHNFTYGPTIHARSQIQHVREARSERETVIGAQIVDAYERNGHLYHVLDAVVSDDDGELARLRHTSIFRPRGT
ncbi:MAG: hypothetical protein ACR2PZ_05470 [Pseudomonadales bacterium]